MASIQSLLNPLPDLSSFHPPSPSLASSTGTEISHPRQKRQKVAKDAPVFNKGKIRGELRYPPCEERDEALSKIHREWQIHPINEIATYPRHIPYNSDKKSFQEKTGREYFEVLQYTFKIPEDDKEWIVMWDYNIGLVRITHLFKCMNYSKTTPSKVLNQNHGLRDICHSITGGALAAQGYWMPFEAAKALAATFCYKIRFALTPLFGLDFPSICLHPNDQNHGRMIIDPAIVRRATETANMYRILETRTSPLSALQPRYHHPTSSPDGYMAPRKKLLPRSHRRHADNLSTTTTATTSSGYASSADDQYNSDAYCVSPGSSCVNSFTPVNTPRSTGEVVYTGTGVGVGMRTGGMNVGSIQTPKEILFSIAQRAGVVSDDEPTGTGTSTASTDDNTSTSPTMYAESSSAASDCPSLDLNDKDEHPIPNDDHGTDPMPPRKRKLTRAQLFAREVKAAHALLSLHMQEASEGDMESTVPVSSLVGVHHQRQISQGYFREDAYGHGHGHGYNQEQGRKRRRASA